MKKKRQIIHKGLSWVTVIAIGCPTGTSFEPSGTSILARNLQNLTHPITKAESILGLIRICNL
jgi:hypothetical protein